MSIHSLLPADTIDYMIAGYVVIFGMMSLYITSLLIRERNLRRDLSMFQALQKRSDEDEHPPCDP